MSHNNLAREVCVIFAQLIILLSPILYLCVLFHLMVPVVILKLFSEGGIARLSLLVRQT